MGKRRSMPVRGQLAGYEDGYRAELVGLGYKPITVEVLVGLLRRLSSWMDDRGLGVGDLCLATAEEFLIEVRSDFGVFRPTVATLESLLAYLRDIDVVPSELAPLPATAVEKTIEAFGHYLEIERAWLRARSAPTPGWWPPSCRGVRTALH